MLASMESKPGWLSGYLRRLGLDHPGEPSAAALFALHRAQVEHVAYENIDIQLGRPPGIDPAESISRILAGRGGYCYNLNGAFATLLQALGYSVSWHRGAVHPAASTPRPEAYGNHLALTVELNETTWMVDAGLGNAHHEPMPLAVGAHRQGPFTYRLERIAAVSDGWRFVHDPALGSFYGMDFSLAPATWPDFLTQHAELSTSPASSFVSRFQIHRRDASGVDSIVGCMLRRFEGGDQRTERELRSCGELFEAATDIFGLRLHDVSESERAAIWRRNRAAHDAWLASGSDTALRPSPAARRSATTSSSPAWRDDAT
jgi:N-hydroxyarylamine O-acetyltransferase